MKKSTTNLSGGAHFGSERLSIETNHEEDKYNQFLKD